MYNYNKTEFETSPKKIHKGTLCYEFSFHGFIVKCKLTVDMNNSCASTILNFG